MLLGVVLAAAVSIDPMPAQSQGSAASDHVPAPVDDDEGAGSGSGSALVAPALPAARAAWLAERMASAIAARPSLGRTKIAIAVTDLVTGEEVFAREADLGLNLASNTKLLTSIAALGTLGNGFRWRTAVFADPADETGTIAGDLYLRGRGDPLLTVAHLEELADELVARGIRAVEGRLVLDTSYFDDTVEPPHFDEQPKERSAFRAPVASLGVARSAATIKVVANPGGTATVTLEPDAGDYVQITKREVVSVTTGRTRLRIDMKPKRDHVEYEVSGQIRVGEGSWDLRRRVDDPARFAAEVFRRALAVRGISIRQRTIAIGLVPLTARLIAAHDSAPLPDVIRFMNKSSDNYVAESLLKTIGAETRTTTAPASWADGVGAVRAYLATLGLAPGTYRADNGSGLFASSEVSARQMVKLLAAAHGNYRIGPDLLGSLPIGGADGTLARRWHAQPAQGRVRAKTGTLDKVLTLAGYVAVDSQSPLAFAIILNDVPSGQRPIARAMVDDMVSVLAAYLGAR
ncbi:MAG: D-alanyl-D-alaninecarboxypeptidase/D-alanyl-D-al anine-endopeptidase [Myxococcales bacterium]|nr:D-alanyl-D-alaninecarboxypeptidase/D-alanyl-D-al anine-endopeptidase [Myxococcales bacterium]